MAGFKMVRADEIRVGDEIWAGGIEWLNSKKCWILLKPKATHPSFLWVRVIGVEPMQIPATLESGRVVQTAGRVLKTVAWDTIKSDPEAVAVRVQ